MAMTRITVTVDEASTQSLNVSGHSGESIEAIRVKGHYE